MIPFVGAPGHLAVGISRALFHPLANRSPVARCPKDSFGPEIPLSSLEKPLSGLGTLQAAKLTQET